MKREDITKIFEGATEEQITAVLDINSADIGSAKKKLEAERDNYKSQLETAQNALKEFDGVDIKEMNEKIKTLNETLQTRENEYQQKIADMEFNSVLDGAIAKSGAKNSKAVMALLDLDALKASKNQADDISKALETVKSENDYMFKSDEPYQNSQVVGNTGGNFGSDSDAAMRAAMGLPPEKK